MQTMNLLKKIRYTVMVIELSGVQFGLKSYVHVISKSDERARHEGVYARTTATATRTSEKQ